MDMNQYRHKKPRTMRSDFLLFIHKGKTIITKIVAQLNEHDLSLIIVELIFAPKKSRQEIFRFRFNIFTEQHISQMVPVIPSLLACQHYLKQYL